MWIFTRNRGVPARFEVAGSNPAIPVWNGKENRRQSSLYDVGIMGTMSQNQHTKLRLSICILSYVMMKIIMWIETWCMLTGFPKAY